MMSALVYQCCRLTCGILYPTYASFKAVRSKNVREYVKWMMFWIVFALFSFVEVFADLFLSWFPFYYELKIGFVLWLSLPATKGSSVIYRKLVHPQLLKHEVEIDSYIDRARDQSYAALIALGARGFTFATNIVLTTAIKGQTKLADTLQKSFSITDLTDTADGVNYRDMAASTLSLTSDDDADNQKYEDDYQQAYRDTGSEQQTPTAETNKPRLRHLNLQSHQADNKWKDEETISSSRTGHSFSRLGKFDDEKSSVSSSYSDLVSSPSSGFGDDLSDCGSSANSPASTPSSISFRPGTSPTLFNRLFTTSQTSSVQSSWRYRSSYTK